MPDRWYATLFDNAIEELTEPEHWVPDLRFAELNCDFVSSFEICSLFSASVRCSSLVDKRSTVLIINTIEVFDILYTLVPAFGKSVHISFAARVPNFFKTL